MFLAEFDSVCHPDPTTMQQHIDKGAVIPQAEDKVRFQAKELCMLRLHGTSAT